MIAIKCICVCLIFSMAEAKLNITEKLTELRNEMAKQNFDAYIIPSEDEHQSEYVSANDKRRAWISGFTGSAGVAIVTKTKAALWTDSRYFIEAEGQLDKNFWTLMKSGMTDVPTQNEWLKQELTANQVVGLCAKFASISSWQNREADLKTASIQLTNAVDDLVDKIWTPSGERPPKEQYSLEIHPLKYAGLTWRTKIDIVKQRINASSADYFVVTALDEIAWLFNLRGKDIPYNPMFFGYALISGNQDNHRIYIEPERNTSSLTEYLKDGDVAVTIKNYQDVFKDLRQESADGKKIWASPLSSYAIYNSITNKDKLVSKSSPVASIKARKTEVELANIRTCMIRDSAARVRHMYWLETEMKKGTLITEMTAANKLEEIQSEYKEHYRSLSFNSISAVGANAALVHYNTNEGNNATLTTYKVYLLDAGAQYVDCTTDITRTHHFGVPTDREISAYTKVLQGAIDLANVVWPAGLYGFHLDLAARETLWRSGMDYGHGTGHGIGYYLSVHESPASIGQGTSRVTDEPLDIGMVESDEPGYYQEGQFGIRLETDVEVVRAKVSNYGTAGRTYLKFNALTLVPFEKNLIDQCSLTNDQVDWLNQYNSEIRSSVTPALDQSYVIEYLREKTEPFKYSFLIPECGKYYVGATSRISLSTSLLVSTTVVISIVKMTFDLFTS